MKQDNILESSLRIVLKPIEIMYTAFVFVGTIDFLQCMSCGKGRSVLMIISNCSNCVVEAYM